VLIPEPHNPADSNAVAIYVNGLHAGFLPRDIAPAVQPSLLALAAANGGRPVSCPCRIIWHDIGAREKAQVVLHMDTARLGIPASSLDHIPELDRVIQQHWHKLASPAPQLVGCDPAARALLAQAEAHRRAVDDDYGSPSSAWQLVERDFRKVARQLQHAGDPMVADAWLGVARSVRYQKGHRDERIEAAVEALHWNLASREAWAELFDIASAAPHMPTLLTLFRRVPVELRPQVLSQLLRLSRRADRLGNMDPEAGARLRAALAAIAEAEGDKPSIKKLRRDARLHPD
jgi:hypothetical protein